jgi:hypothetical protein
VLLEKQARLLTLAAGAAAETQAASLNKQGRVVASQVDAQRNSGMGCVLTLAEVLSVR